MSEIENYVRAATLEEAYAYLEHPTARLIAGGTDILLRSQRDPAAAIQLVDISDIQALQGVSVEPGGVRIGAGTRLSDVVRAEALKAKPYRALIQGAVQVGSPQIRNLATLGGNICNAAPSADTSAPLLLLDACAEIESARGKRKVALAEFFTGPGKTVLQCGEILVSFFLPEPPADAVSVYLKHCPRRAMDLAVVGVGVLLAPGHLESLRIALSAVAPTPIRAYAAEQYILQAGKLDEKTICESARLAADAARPISDVRASAEYRKRMVEVLTKKALHQALGLLGEN